MSPANSRNLPDSSASSANQENGFEMNYQHYENPLVSVIINNYNYARFLGATIESALEQTYQSVEVIVVDDGSTDDSKAVIESYGERVKAIYKCNGGQASAMNAGFAAARGELIYFLDSDDIALPDCLEKVIERYRSAAELPAILQFRLQVIDADGELLNRSMPEIERMQGGEARQLLKDKGSYVFPPTSGNVFRRAVLRHIMPIPIDDFRVCADVYLCTKAALHGSIEVFEEMLGRYRVHGENNWATPLKISDGERVENFVEVMMNEAAVRKISKKICAAHWSRPIGGNSDLLYLIFKSTRQKLAKNAEKTVEKKNRFGLAKQFLAELRVDHSRVPFRNRFGAMIYLMTIALLPKRLVYSLIEFVFVHPPKPVGAMLKKSFGR